MRMPIVSFLERPSFLFFRVAIPYLWAENELAHLQLGNESKLTKESCYKIWGHAKRLSQNWSLTIFLEQLTLKIDIFDQHISCAFPALGYIASLPLLAMLAIDWSLGWSKSQCAYFCLFLHPLLFPFCRCWRLSHSHFFCFSHWIS